MRGRLRLPEVCPAVLSGLPEVVVRVPGLEGGEFKWVNPGVDWKWPGKPPVSVSVFDAIVVGCAAYWKEKELLGPWSESEDTGCASVAQEKSGNESCAECGADEWVVEWRMVMLPRRCVVFEC